MSGERHTRHAFLDAHKISVGVVRKFYSIAFHFLTPEYYVNHNLELTTSLE